MEQQELKCGCDCDSRTQVQQSPNGFLTREQAARLLEEKITRIRQMRELQKSRPNTAKLIVK